MKTIAEYGTDPHSSILKWAEKSRILLCILVSGLGAHLVLGSSLLIIDNEICFLKANLSLVVVGTAFFCSQMLLRLSQKPSIEQVDMAVVKTQHDSGGMRGLRAPDNYFLLQPLEKKVHHCYGHAYFHGKNHIALALFVHGCHWTFPSAQNLTSIAKTIGF